MAHTTVLYCPTVSCPEHAVDIELRYAIGRWWADTNHCPACGAQLSEEPSVDKVSPRTDGVSDFEHVGLKPWTAVADALPRDLPGSVRR